MQAFNLSAQRVDLRDAPLKIGPEFDRLLNRDPLNAVLSFRDLVQLP